MAQHIRPAQSQAAIAATVATSASPPATDQRDLHYRICATVGASKGTTQYGTLKTTNTSQRPIVMLDATYAALVTAGVNFADALYNSATAEAVETSSSEIPCLWNPGLHRQVGLNIGDSLTEGPTGATAYPDLSVLSNQLGLMGATSSGKPVVYVAAEGAPYFVPDRAYTYDSTDAKSRIVFNLGHGGWRCVNLPGFTYVAGSPWLDNISRMSKLVLHSGQQLVAYIFLGTNDFSYADSVAPNTGLDAVPTGTPGYTYAGSPNYPQDALTPLITALKAAYPTIKIIWQSSVARGNSTPLNSKFFEAETYIVANKVALGIDIVVKSSAIAAFDPRNAAVVTANLAYYQSDSTHLTPAGYALHRPYREAAYDKLLGFAYPGGIAEAFA